MKTKSFARSRFVSKGLWPTLIVAASIGAAGLAHAAEYRLGVQDRVRISVVEWALNDLQSPINGEFVVNSDGELALPLLGDIEGAGRTTSDVARIISERLKEKLALQSSPVTSVEVVAYRPFYILGDVQASGEFAFRPGLTVLQALSLAGGHLRSAVSAEQAAREIITTSTDLASLKGQVDALRAAEARLTSELAGKPTIAFPKELESRKESPAVAAIMQSEQALFDARRSNEATRKAAAAKISELVEREVAALQAHAAAVKRQAAAVQSQLEVVSSLRDKGLGSSSREMDLERALSDIQSREQDIYGRIIGVQQEAVRALEAQDTADAQRRLEATAELQRVRSDTASLAQRIAAMEKTLALTKSGTADGRQASYVIVRTESQQPQILMADEFTQLQPGDVLRVFRGPLPASIEGRIRTAQEAAPKSPNKTGSEVAQNADGKGEASTKRSE